MAEIATTAAVSPETLSSLSDAGVFEKFFKLNTDKLTMFLPADHPEVPWTALIIGLWIPNFYYWGFNQYIIQRTLGASSLAEGQKGVIFAAGLKLIIPFIIVIPGIIAFNLFAAEQAKSAMNDQKILAANAGNYSIVYFDMMEALKKPVTPKDTVAAFTYTVQKSEAPSKVAVISEAEAGALYDAYKADKDGGKLAKVRFEYDDGWAKTHGGENGPKALVDRWNRNRAATNSGGDARCQKALRL